MAVNATITITSPTGANSVMITPTVARIMGSTQEPARLYCMLEYGFSWYSDDDDPTNAVQANATVVVARNGVQIFDGYIPNKRLIEASEQIIEFEALDNMAKLRKTVASISGEPLFTQTTPFVKITEHILKQAAPLGDTLFPFYPEASDTDPWIPSASSNQTELFVSGGGSLGAAETTIVAQPQQKGFPPLGFIRIDTEWIQYDGYDTFSGSTRYRFKNCVRGSLGTTAATHADGSTIFLREMQGLHPAIAIFVEAFNTITSGWEPIDTNLYTVAPDDGRFDFTIDILNFVTTEKNYNNVRASFGVFDEDNVDVVDLKSIIDSVLTETVANLGPGLVDGVDLAVAAVLTNIKITRVQLTETENTLAFVKNLIDEIGLNSDPDDDSIGIYWHQADGEMRVEPIRQKTFLVSAINQGTRTVTTAVNVSSDISVGDVIVISDSTGNNGHYTVASVTWTGSVTDIVVDGELASAVADGFINNADFKFAVGSHNEEEINIDSINSAIMVSYETGLNINMVSPDRMWHPAKGEAVGSNAIAVQNIWFQDEEEIRLDGWEKINATATGNNHFTDRLTDALKTSGWGMRFQSDPGEQADVLYMWFDVALNTFIVDAVDFVLDCRRFIQATNTYHFECLGIDANFDKVDPTNIPEANKINISGGLDFRLPAGWSDAWNAVEIGAEDIGALLQGLVCRYNGMSTRNNENQNLALIKEIRVRGRQRKTVTVQLTDDDTLGSQFLYAPVTYAKLLRDDGAAINTSHQVKRFFIGQGTFNSAVSLGRLALLQNLAYHRTRQYRISAHLGGKGLPEVTDTVTMIQSDFTGIVMDKRYELNKGVETLNLRLLDYRSVII